MRLLRSCMLGLFLVCGMWIETQARPQHAASVAKQLVGTWRLVSWTDRLADGTTTKDPLSVGYLIYTDTNRMCATMTNPNRPKWKSQTAPTPEEAKSGIDGLVPYCSTIEVHATEGFVLNHVEIAKAPNGVGNIRKRWFTFEEPNRLILRIDPPENISPVVDSTLVWERLEKSSK